MTGRLQSPHDGHTVRHNERWDSYACLTCNEWIESECGCELGTCEYQGRPATPDLSAPAREQLTGGSEPAGENETAAKGNYPTNESGA